MLGWRARARKKRESFAAKEEFRQKKVMSTKKKTDSVSFLKLDGRGITIGP